MIKIENLIEENEYIEKCDACAKEDGIYRIIFDNYNKYMTYMRIDLCKDCLKELGKQINIYLRSSYDK